MMRKKTLILIIVLNLIGISVLLYFVFFDTLRIKSCTCDVQNQKYYNFTVCFSPKNNCVKLILKEIKEAKSNIWLQGYSFTSKPISEALIRAHHKGIDVKVILDKSQTKSKHSVIKSLLYHNIPIWIDFKPTIAHNKIILIDDSKVLTGSYNWSQAAEYKNAENLILLDSKFIYEKYKKNFLYRKSLSKNYAPLKNQNNQNI